MYLNESSFIKDVRFLKGVIDSIFLECLGDSGCYKLIFSTNSDHIGKMKVISENLVNS